MKRLKLFEENLIDIILSGRGDVTVRIGPLEETEIKSLNSGMDEECVQRNGGRGVRARIEFDCFL
jgi:hypothetical protein